MDKSGIQRPDVAGVERMDLSGYRIVDSRKQIFLDVINWVSPKSSISKFFKYMIHVLICVFY